MNGVIRSTDQGFSWEQVLFLTNGKSVIFANNSGIVMTSTIITSIYDTNKVYISTDFGDNWKSMAQPTGFGISITDIKQDNEDQYFIGTDGEGLYKVDLVTGIKEISQKIENFALYQNYPNPFNPTTTIRYSIHVSGLVKIEVYNILGQEIRTLVNQYEKKGEHVIEFNANNLPSGVYIYRLTTENFTSSKKLILLK